MRWKTWRATSARPYPRAPRAPCARRVDPDPARQLPEALHTKPIHRHLCTKLRHHVGRHPAGAGHVQTLVRPNRRVIQTKHSTEDRSTTYFQCECSYSD